MLVKSAMWVFVAVTAIALALALSLFIEFSALPAGWAPSH